MHAAGQVEDSYAETDRCTLSLDVRDIQSILQSKDHHSKLQVKGVAGTQNRSFNSELHCCARGVCHDSKCRTGCPIIIRSSVRFPAVSSTGRDKLLCECMCEWVSIESPWGALGRKHCLTPDEQPLRSVGECVRECMNVACV